MAPVGRLSPRAEDRCHVGFDYVLHDPRAMPFLLDYLSHIEQVQVLFFWLEVEEYKQMTGRTGDLLSQARKIYEKYFEGEWEETVFGGLDAGEAKGDFDLVEVRAAIREQLEQGMPTLDIFSAAHHVVETALKDTFFVSFRQSSSFKALLDELRNRQSLSVSQILDNPTYINYFADYLENEDPMLLGNFLFLSEIHNSYGAGAPPTPPTPASPSDANISLERRGSHSSVQVEASQTKKVMTRRQQSHPPLFGRWNSGSSTSTNISEPSIGVGTGVGQGTSGGATPPGGRRERTSQLRETSRATSFIDMLPVGAAPASAASELREKRNELLVVLNMAYQVLDKYLSRSSPTEANLVTDESRRFVATCLERIAGELGGGNGRLASVGGLASISTAYSVLESLAAQLENVFRPAQADILSWMREKAIPKFKETENFAALIAHIEETTSDFHQKRLELQSILSGAMQTSKLLVLNLPDTPYTIESGSQQPQDESLSESAPRPGQIRCKSKSPSGLVVERLAHVTTVFAGDERTPVESSTLSSLCECNCHYDGHKDRCLCDCGEAPSLTRRAGRLVFRTKTKTDVCFGDADDLAVVRAPTDGGDIDLNTEGEPSPPENQMFSTVAVDSHAFVLPLGLSVRVLDTEELEREPLERLLANFRTRHSNDPDNAIGKIKLPPKPLTQYSEYRVKETVPASKTTSDEEPPHYHIRKSSSNTGKKDPRDDISQVEKERDLETKIRALCPVDSVHCFSRPGPRPSASESCQERETWHGVCYTRYRLKVIACQSLDKMPTSPTELDQEEEKVPLKSYSQLRLTLIRHPEFGLGFKFFLNEHGFVELQNFAARPDGSYSPIAESGLLQPGDVLIALDGVELTSRRFDDVIEQIKAARGPIKFVFARGWQGMVKRCKYCDKIKCLPTYVFVPECLVALSKKPDYTDMRRAVLACFPLVMSGDEEGLEAARQKIRQMNELAVTKIPKSPSNSTLAASQATRFPFMQLFRFIRKENVADVLASLLLERSVVLVSKSTSVLTFVGEALRQLLYPFVWNHLFCPLLPITMCTQLARKRHQLLASSTEPSSSHPFFIGICTLEIGARSTTIGEFAGFEEIREWMTEEHDYMRPLDHLLSLKQLEPLLVHGTIVLDVDADILEVPFPSGRAIIEAEKLQQQQQQQQQQHHQASLDNRRGIVSSRFSHPLYRYDDANFNVRRLRAASSASANSIGSALAGQATNQFMGHMVHSFVPSFPATLRDRLLEEWESLEPEERTPRMIGSKLLDIQSSMLAAYREYLLTFRPDGNLGHKVLTFDIRTFLRKGPKIYRPFLSVFLRTQLFAQFLVKCVNEKRVIFTRRKGEGTLWEPEMEDPFSSMSDELQSAREVERRTPEVLDAYTAMVAPSPTPGSVSEDIAKALYARSVAEDSIQANAKLILDDGYGIGRGEFSHSVYTDSGVEGDGEATDSTLTEQNEISEEESSGSDSDSKNSPEVVQDAETLSVPAEEVKPSSQLSDISLGEPGEGGAEATGLESCTENKSAAAGGSLITSDQVSVDDAQAADGDNVEGASPSVRESLEESAASYGTGTKKIETESQVKDDEPAIGLVSLADDKTIDRKALTGESDLLNNAVQEGPGSFNTPEEESTNVLNPSTESEGPQVSAQAEGSKSSSGQNSLGKDSSEAVLRDSGTTFNDVTLEDASLLSTSSAEKESVPAHEQDRTGCEGQAVFTEAGDQSVEDDRMDDLPFDMAQIEPGATSKQDEVGPVSREDKSEEPQIQAETIPTSKDADRVSEVEPEFRDEETPSQSLEVTGSASMAEHPNERPEIEERHPSDANGSAEAVSSEEVFIEEAKSSAAGQVERSLAEEARAPDGTVQNSALNNDTATTTVEAPQSEEQFSPNLSDEEPKEELVTEETELAACEPEMVLSEAQPGATSSAEEALERLASGATEATAQDIKQEEQPGATSSAEEALERAAGGATEATAQDIKQEEQPGATSSTEEALERAAGGATEATAQNTKQDAPRSPTKTKSSKKNKRKKKR